MKSNWQQIPGERKSAILEQWLQSALALFPEKMASGTPTGEALLEGMSMVLDNFDGNGESCGEGINSIARIFAVQPLRPSVALSLFPLLGELIMEKAPASADTRALKARIDAITFEAFDRFLENREKIYQLKVEETRSQLHMLLRSTVS
ncbi:hypothetical protein EKD00_03180 [Chlorobium phaeovibrioides]|uniref:RsbT co-antagonist protein RsbRD N-terminal domain-containing protein n=2 Tax=Chlorobium phaeovibrioides TaxID=1094 RepID=A0A432AUJ4_CHLPH|nr:RsbRD N-terminal domain-containing protein [Chlorobium phaeovibrioides]QEQ56261.1 hypothetical protein FNV82_00100 [Chlorobium phaeovibrioides]RTY36750.1 hypothetical protein EKD00_03180 [Chlorobium phaeovibrioides]RTY38164.1 hypothetical protein EKD02_05565 [Chlorobium phaeovibrioides]HCD35675.1 hypothetical protein [Chlorobium sp.]